MNRKNLTAVVLAGLLGFFAFIGNAQALDKCMTGAWYDPARDGEGIELTVLDEDTIYGYFYTFRYDRTEWFSMLGGHDFLAADMRVYRTVKNEASHFDATVWDVGSASVDLVTQDHIVFTFHLNLDLYDGTEGGTPWCLHGGCNRQYEYVRLTQPIACSGMPD
jgi:hypothetical protein